MSKKWQITGPDGKIYEVEGPTREGALQAVRDMVEKQTTQPPSPTAEPTSRFGRFMHGVGNTPVGVAQFMANSGLYARPQVAAGSQRGRELYGEMSQVKPQDVARAANQFVDQREAEYQARREAAGESGFDGWRMVGNIAATAPLAFAGPTGAAMSIPRAVATDVALGTAASAAMPVIDAGDKYFEEKAKQVGTGAVTSALTGGVMRGGGRVLGPTLDAAQQRLANKGISLTPGAAFGGWLKSLEERLQSVPVAGDAIASAQRKSIRDFNRALYEEVLAPIGEVLPKTVMASRAGVKYVGNKISKAYDDLLTESGVRFTPDRQFLDDFANLRELTRYMPDQGEIRVFNNALKNKIAPFFEGGSMDATSFKKLESELTKLVNQYAKREDLSNAFRETLSLMRESLERQNPKFAGRLGDINKSWAMLARLEGAASMKGAREGIFTPDQLLSAIRAQENTVRKRGYARGDAMLQEFAETAQNVIGNTYPDSGTTGRILSGLAVGGYFSPEAATAYGALSLPYLAPKATRAFGKGLEYGATPTALAAGVTAGSQ